MPILLTERDVRQLLPMRDLIDAMDAALAAFSTGKVRQPVRPTLELGTHGFFSVMPAAYALAEPDPVLGTAAAGAKLVTVVPRNHDRGLPSHLATIFMLDAETGALDAILDGRYITEARTAAVSAVSARHLARPGSTTAAIIGSGVQARSHADALSNVFAIGEFRIWSPTPAHRESAAGDIEHLTGRRVIVSASAQSAVDGADLVCLVTSATDPVIEDSWVGGQAHVMAVGSSMATMREMPAALVARGRLTVDSREAALKEAGDFILAEREGVTVNISAELGEICAGFAPGRTGDDGVTIFKSLGLAIEDVVSAQLVVERARATGAGAAIPL